MSYKENIVSNEQIVQAEVDMNLSAIEILSSLEINLSKDKKNENIIIFGEIDSGKKIRL